MLGAGPAPHLGTPMPDATKPDRHLIPESLVKQFEQGYHPTDEPPGLEEWAYKQWKAGGGKVIPHTHLVCEVQLADGTWAVWGRIGFVPDETINIQLSQLQPRTRVRWVKPGEEK